MVREGLEWGQSLKNKMEPTMKKLGAEAYDKTTKAR